MNIKFLGTGAAEGIPAIFCNCDVCRQAKESGGKNIRTRFQILINRDFLVDYPPDSYMHMVQNKLDFSKVKSIVITHSHSDHFYPEDLFMRDLRSSYNASQPLLTVYGTDVIVGRLIRENLAFAGGEAKKDIIERFHGYDVYDRRVECERLLPQSRRTIDGYEVLSILSEHIRYEPSLVYAITKEGKTALILSDTAYLSQESLDFIKSNVKRADGIVYDFTYGLDRAEEGHMNYDDVKKLRVFFEKNKIAVSGTKHFLSHISHNVTSLHEQLCGIVEKDGFIVAYDGMEAEL